MKMTQKQKILRHLSDYGSITSWEAYREYGITQLGARIWELKQAGIKFDTEMQISKNRYGEPAHFKTYRLHSELAKLATD